ncbi:MAG TPA: kelch repeat-containing protein [Myxococcota bacterium]|nr:kelch repeat-containing protein [Myxococcota bacterium]
MAFAGRVLAGERRHYDYGVGALGLVYYDPSSRVWKHAAKEGRYKTRVVVHPGTSDLKTGAFTALGTPKPLKTEEISAEFELPLGGGDRQGRAYWFVYPGFLRFDPRSNRWDQPEAPIQHLFPAAPKLDWVEGTSPSWRDREEGVLASGSDGRLYLVGGVGAVAPREPTVGVIDGLDIYDPETNSWQKGAPMKRARQSLAAAFGHDGRLYVFGGCACEGVFPLYNPSDPESKRVAKAEAEAQRRMIDVTEVYDPKTDTWSTVASDPTPRMLAAAATGADGKIYVIGGQTQWGSDPLALVEVYDPATNRWSLGPSLRVPRLGHGAVTAADGTIWVIGGSAASPSATEIMRAVSGDKGGPTASVETLKTAPSSQ